MSKPWTFEEPLDSTDAATPEERAQIAALFDNKQEDNSKEVDYGAAFKQQHLKKAEQKPEVKVKETALEKPKQTSTPTRSSTVTTDYKTHLSELMIQNDKAIAGYQQQIETLHRQIDETKQQNKKLQAISEAIDDL